MRRRKIVSERQREKDRDGQTGRQRQRRDRRSDGHTTRKRDLHTVNDRE